MKEQGLVSNLKREMISRREGRGISVGGRVGANVEKKEKVEEEGLEQKWSG